MSAIDDFLATQPGAQGASAGEASSAPQTVDDLLARDATTQSVPPALRAPKVAQAQNSQWQAPGGFMTGVGDVVRGGVQDLVHGISWAADKIAPNSQFAQDARAALPQMQQTIDAQNQQYAQQRAANGESGTDWMRLAGNAVGTLPTMALGGDFAAAPFLGKLGIGALQGAVGAGLMPTTGNSDQSFAHQKAVQMEVGGLMGGAVPLVAIGAKAAGQGAWNALRPVLKPNDYVGEGMTAMLSPQDAATAASNIRSAPTFTPGYQPTTAQVAGLPFFVQTEKAAGNLPTVKNAMAQRAVDNNATLWNSLNQVAGTDLDLQNAIAARAKASNPLYNLAKQQNIPVDAPMTDLMSRPAMSSAIDRAQKLASNMNAGPIFQSTRIPNSMGGSPTTVKTLTGNGAQAVKEALDAMLLSENTQKLSSKEIGALQDTRSAYLAWLEGHSPEFTQARQTFASMSPPINTMQAAQQMQQLLGGLGRSMDVAKNPILTGPGYASALNRALSNQEFGIEPQAQTALENIGRDLQRGTISNSIRSPGSDTAYNLAANGWLARQLYGPTFGGAGAAGKAVAALGATALGHPMVGLGILGGANKIGKMVGNRLQDRLSGLLLNPDAVLPYLDARAAAASQSIPGPIMQGLLNYGRPAAVNGLLGGLQNSGNK